MVFNLLGQRRAEGSDVRPVRFCRFGRDINPSDVVFLSPFESVRRSNLKTAFQKRAYRFRPVPRWIDRTVKWRRPPARDYFWAENGTICWCKTTSRQEPQRPPRPVFRSPELVPRGPKTAYTRSVLVQNSTSPAVQASPNVCMRKLKARSVLGAGTNPTGCSWFFELARTTTCILCE